MPELPEIETIRRSLARSIVGRRVEGVTVHDTRLRVPVSQRVLRRELVGRTVSGVDRRSKYLLVECGDPQLVLHLGMSGRLLRQPAEAPRLPHTHVRFALDDGTELRFVDPRRFGLVFVVARAALDSHPRFADLGPEPLSAGFTAAVLAERAGTARRPIKNVLMDAAIVVGVGNIYACEALHRAAIHPGTIARRIRGPRWERLHTALQEVLRDAVEARGTTLQDFRDSDGMYGGFQFKLAVYGRSGENCGRCGRVVRRIVQAGRSTFYCPGCQR
jgi:formamidopyrimidine-DNA glycosylase